MRAVLLVVWVLLLGATGATLFHITFEVEALESELTRLNNEIVEEQEAVHVLEAEWSYQNRPARLEQLSADWLPMLDRIHPGQVMTLDALPMRRATEENDGDDAPGAPAPPIGPAADADKRGAEALPASLRTSEGGT
ncbi:MAG: hypothetical protein RIB45_09405 [Marivibrio sp.]|uniref:cell division protein FtsL n=1 Tax=Marivibrio sp. TaxID=2039719 RepID=UPI0032ED644D